MEHTNDKYLWIFGYGSLCWNPGFEYLRSTTGFVRGYNRRFWQGNTTHRGTAEKPGRVATLIAEEEGVVHGRAFQVKDNTALLYLEQRECSSGGYRSTVTTFYSRNGKRCFPVIIYIATRKNEHWLGEAPLRCIAKQITECAGTSGHNVEYLLRLAEFMHHYLPEAQDEHLFTLEHLVRSRIKERNMCLLSLMGSKNFPIDLDYGEIDHANEETEPTEARAPVVCLVANSFQHVSRVQFQVLRCLKM